MEIDKRILDLVHAQMRRRQFLQLAALAAGAGALAACAPTVPGAAPAATAAGGSSSGSTASGAAQELRYPLSIEDTGNWDYTLSGGGSELTIGLELMDALTTIDLQTGDAKPKVAESWKFNEDGTFCTFTLRKDVTWSDGTNVTAHDYEYAIKRNFDPATKSGYAWALYPIKGGEDVNTGKSTDLESIGVKATDDYTLEVTLREPTPYLPLLMSLWVAFPLKKDLIDAKGTDWWKPENSITNGPFKPTAFTVDQSWVVERNDKYWDTMPTITKVTYTLFQNDETQALASYEAGELDIAIVPSTDIERVQADATLSKELNISKRSANYQMRLDNSNADSPLAKKEVRQALYLAIDRETLCKDVLKNTMSPAYTFIPEGTVGYNPAAQLKGTVDDAKKLMETAGYPGGKGFPGFKLVYVAAQGETNLMCQAIAGMWKDNLGIDNVELVPAPTDWRTQIKTQPFDMYIGRWYADYEDPQDWHNLAIVEDSFSTHYTKKDWVDAANAAKIELDPAKRKAMYEAAEVSLIEDCPIIPLTWPLEVWVFKPNVKGLVPRRLIGYPNYRAATVEATA